MSRSELDQPTFPPTQLQGREMSDLYGFDGLNSLWRRVAVTPAGALIVATGGDISELDDNDIAQGQSTGFEITIGYINDGTKWIRQQGGVDNTPAPASPQGGFSAGVVRAALPVYADGDVSLFNFNTSGQLMVDAEGITEGDDNSIAPGQTSSLNIPLNYIYNGTDWIRQMGGVDNAPAAVSPQGSFIAGISRTGVLPIYADGDVVIPSCDVNGRLLTFSSAASGTVITTPADTAVAIAATVALPVPPVAPATTRMTVQNVGPAGSFLRVREVGAGAGRGVLLGRFSSVTYGGPGGSIAALEVEDVSGAVTGIPVATSAMIEFERV